jgi:hypothetical protein
MHPRLRVELALGINAEQFDDDHFEDQEDRHLDSGAADESGGAAPDAGVEVQRRLPVLLEESPNAD